LASRGPIGTLRVLVQRLTSATQKPVAQHPFDLEHGVDTSGLIGGGDLGVGHVHDVYITGYVGVSPSRFDRTIRRWTLTPPLERVENYSFVDLGCGKGRAVLLASELQFREVIGVELNADLARIAEANVEIWKAAGRALCPVRIVCGDATEFTLPPGPSLVYLANPFGAPVMSRLLKSLKAQVVAQNQTLDVIYQNPEQERVFVQDPDFVLLWSEMIFMSKLDEEVDPVSTKTDRCNAYRLVR
jgi:SAM-dependent methyltransferase